MTGGKSSGKMFLSTVHQEDEQTRKKLLKPTQLIALKKSSTQTETYASARLIIATVEQSKLA